MEGMVVCRIEASPPDAYKTYSVVDFNQDEQAIYGIVNSPFRGDALIIKSLDYHHSSNAAYKSQPWPSPEIEVLTQDQEILGILRQYEEF